MLGFIGRLASPKCVAQVSALLAVLLAAPAYATWSIILINVRTGEIVLGSATCLTSFDLKAGTPVIVPGFGAVTAQSFVDSTGQNRVFARDQLLMGTDPTEILNRLRVFDTGHETRQYGIVDTLGRTATFSGLQASQWKGGVTGTFSTPDGDVAYAIQGNILTGAPVVTAAEAAVINTPGDLAEKLMAGMEAARLMGGDGRCSCAGSPTSCGSPPPNFTKSAHIAYMLIARDGDTPGCHGLYRVTRPAWDVALGDLDEDGRPDAVTVSSTASELSVLYNATEPNSPFVLFEQRIVLPSNNARDIRILDVNADNIMDIVTADSTNGTVTVIIGKPGRDFELPVTYPAGASPEYLAVADFDGVNGPDLAAVSTGVPSITILLNSGSGTFVSGATFALPDRPNGIVAADADNDNDADLLMPIIGQDTVQIYDNDGNAVFTAGLAVPTAAGPNSIAVADLDQDFDLDIAVGTASDNAITVLLREGATYTRTDMPLGARALNVSIGNTNHDAHPDLIAVRGHSRDFCIFEGVGDGSFKTPTHFQMAYNTVRVDVADLDGDGLDDVVGGSLARQALAVFENETKPGGTTQFTDGQGCAQGDWFMDFNVAFQSSGAPDPVFQLKDMFDQWRTELIGRPDAIQSVVTYDTPVLRASHSFFSGENGTMRIKLLDWQGAPITAPLVSPPTVIGTGIMTIGAAVPLGNGVWDIPIRARGEIGTEQFSITVDDGIRPVTLMPRPTVEATCYADCDQSTGVGTLDIFDFLCFQNEFLRGDPFGYACSCATSDPEVCDIFDFLCYQNAFVAGCP